MVLSSCPCKVPFWNLSAVESHWLCKAKGCLIGANRNYVPRGSQNLLHCWTQCLDINWSPAPYPNSVVGSWEKGGFPLSPSEYGTLAPCPSYRVLKWWCHKNLILEIMGFVGIFWKNIWKAYLPKTSIAGQIVLEIIVPFCSDWWLHTNPSKFDSVPNVMNWVKFRWICMESSLAYNWAKISKMLFIISRKSHNFTNLIFYDATL